MAIADLRNNEMMAHLLEALESGEKIGHYGRLVFTMVARHFLEETELIERLSQDPECSKAEAHSLIHQVHQHDYSPPRRERVLEWQQHQDLPICPNPDDPDACNVYKDLQFPAAVYDYISDYYEHKGS